LPGAKRGYRGYTLTLSRAQPSSDEANCVLLRPVRVAEWAPRRFVLATAARNQSTVRATAAATSLCRAVVKPWLEWGDKRVTTLPGQGSGPRQRTCKACAPTRRW
jgi:hypothetical protein